jgi:phage-related protein
LSDIGVKLGVEGESEFKNALKDINTNLKTLGTEMKAVTSAFDRNDTSIENLSAQNKVLNKQIDEQNTKLEMLKAKLAESAKEYGENDAKTQKWQQAVNLATADLNKSELQLKNNIAALEEAGGESEDAGKKAKKSGDDAEKGGDGWDKFGGVLKGVAVAAGAVAVAAGAAAVKIGKEVVAAFGELEQNLGGSEAVFGEYAASIQKTGEDAYKNLGVSQSDYLATANKMGALFQGSGIEQQESLKLTEQAMQRAADMASVMGIDMSSAMEAVTGAAKGNYTMMDNLGVKMDDTSVKAFAVANGFNGVWSEASNAEKAQYAMQMFFDSTSQYAGNFAKEATQTITGSIGLLKAALGSFTAGLGNTDADMQNLTENLVDAFQAVVANVVPIIENLTNALPTALAAILPAISGLLPSLLRTVTTLFRQVLDAVFLILPELIPVAVDALMVVVDALIDNIPLLIEAALVLVTSLAVGLTDALPELIPAAVDAVITVVETLIDNIDMLIDAAIAIIMALADGLIESLPKLIEKAPVIIANLVSAIITNAPKLLAAAVELIISLSTGLEENFRNILNKVGGWINDNIIQPIKDKVSDFVSAGGDLIAGVWRGISDKAEWLWNQVSGFFTSLTDRIKNFFGIASPSKLFADEIGENLAAGIGVGFQDKMRDVAKQMNDSIPTSFTSPTITATSRAMEGAVNGMAALMGNQASTFIIQTVLDGRVIAETIFDPLKSVSRQRGVALA